MSQKGQPNYTEKSRELLEMGALFKKVEEATQVLYGFFEKKRRCFPWPESNSCAILAPGELFHVESMEGGKVTFWRGKEKYFCYPGDRDTLYLMQIQRVEELSPLRIYNISGMYAKANNHFAHLPKEAFGLFVGYDISLYDGHARPPEVFARYKFLFDEKIYSISATKILPL